MLLSSCVGCKLLQFFSNVFKNVFLPKNRNAETAGIKLFLLARCFLFLVGNHCFLLYHMLFYWGQPFSWLFLVRKIFFQSTILHIQTTAYYMSFRPSLESFRKAKSFAMFYVCQIKNMHGLSGDRTLKSTISQE